MSAPRKKKPPENYGKEGWSAVAAFLPWRVSSTFHP
jgi:hypothetical protein